MLKYDDNFHDSYSEEVIFNQSGLFERAADKGYDMENFINCYMNSSLRMYIDKRAAIECNMIDIELLEAIEGGFRQGFYKLPLTYVKGHKFNGFLAGWIGEFYAKLQDRLWISSAEVLKRYPAKEIMIKSRGLHDTDIDLIIDRIIANQKNRRA